VSGGGRVKVETPMPCRTVFVLILLFLLLTSCIPIPSRDIDELSITVLDEKHPTSTLPWLIEGKTTKKEVIRNENFSHVNPRILSQGRILVYCINLGEQKEQFIGSNTCRHQLVLVFDEKDIVKRFNILKVNW
jgi:hypothetical protein